MYQYFQDVLMCFNDTELNGKSRKFDYDFLIFLTYLDFELCGWTTCKMRCAVFCICGVKITADFTGICIPIKLCKELWEQLFCEAEFWLYMQNTRQVSLSFFILCSLWKSILRDIG